MREEEFIGGDGERKKQQWYVYETELDFRGFEFYGYLTRRCILRRGDGVLEMGKGDKRRGGGYKRRGNGFNPIWEKVRLFM